MSDPNVVAHRQKTCHLLTLIEKQARQARENLCMSDEIGEAAQKPNVVLARFNGAGGLQSQDQSAQQRQVAVALNQSAAGSINDVVNLTQKLAVFLGSHKPAGEAGEDQGTVSPK